MIRQRTKETLERQGLRWFTVVEDIARVPDAGGVEDGHGVFLEPTDGVAAGPRVFHSDHH